MARIAFAATFSLLLSWPVCAQDRQAYKWQMPSDQVQAFESAEFGSGCIDITFEKGHCAPIVTDVGVTGLTVVAPGHLVMRIGADQPIIEADIHGVMLRFNPDDREDVFTAENAETYDDPGFAAMAHSITMGVFKHCWHSGWNALIPPAGSVSVDFLSKQHGDVLVWDNGQEYGAYNFTARTEIAKGQL